MNRPSTQLEHFAAANRRGAVLIIVLILVVMIALAGFGFVSEMTTEYEATKINGDLLQAQQVMASAEVYLLSKVEQKKRPSPANAAIPTASGDTDFRAITLQSFDGSAGTMEQPLADSEWRFAVFQDLSSFDAAQQQQSSRAQLDELDQLGNLDAFAAPEFGLMNESAKLNLGRVLYWDSVEPGRGRRALLQIPGMTNESADSILDWIDADDTPRQLGAEADYYRQQQCNVTPRNGIPATLTELLQVRGVTRSVFFGSSSSQLEGTLGWEQMLTVTSAESKVSTPNQINIAELSPSNATAFESKLAQAVPQEVARYVTLALMAGVTTSSGQLPVIGPLEVSPSTLAFDSVAATVQLPDLIDSFVLLPDPQQSRLVRSPLASNDAASLQNFARLERLLTSFDTSLPALRGRINILKAREEVLRALTDDPAIASQIVQQRQSLSDDDRRSTVWLLSRRIVDLTMYQSLYADITPGGDVYSGEIIVYRPVGGPFLRRKITIDAANGGARRINWLDKSSLPLPVTLDQLEPQEGLSLFD